MKKRMISLVLALMMCFSLSVTAFAAENSTEFNPLTMTAEERMGWIAEHGELAYHGNLSNTTRSHIFNSNLNSTVISSEDIILGQEMPDIGRLRTRIYYTVNDNFTLVEDFGTITCEADILLSGTMKEVNLITNSEHPDEDVRLLYECYFTRVENVYYISHLYIIYPDGTHDVRIHKFEMNDMV